MRSPFILFLGFPGVASAATWTVDPAGSGDFTTVEQALLAAGDGDEIVLYDGSHGPVVVSGARALYLRGQPSPGGSVTVASVSVFGADATLTVEQVDITGAPQAVEAVEGTLELSRVRIRDGGDDADGFAVAARADAQVALRDVIISRIAGGEGVVFAEDGATLSAGGVWIEECWSGHGGAVRVHEASAVLSDVQMIDNRALEGGALAVAGGTLVADGLVASGNSAGLGGAIAVSEGSTVEVSDSDLTRNQALDGGHLFVAGGDVRLVRSRMSAGVAERGGAVALRGGTLRVDNFSWSDQEEALAGGALYVVGGEAYLRFGVMAGNPAGIGGGLAMDGGTVEMEGVIVARNGAEAIAVAGSGAATFSLGIIWGNEYNNAVLGDVDLGAGVVDADPRFVDPAYARYALRARSPGIDAGVDGEFDPDGTPADMGMFGGVSAWVLPDADGDGFAEGRDCDDQDASVNETAPDAWYDGTDSNCDGADDFDQDGDGFAAWQLGGTDCVDTDPLVNPGMKEVAGDDRDTDCDGLVDPDHDRDGWSVALDCDDSDPETWPGAEETWYDGVDSDCDQRDDFDQDGDGFPAADFGGGDCDDTDPRINPTRVEIVGDGIDNDCDGETLEIIVAEEEDEGEAWDAPEVEFEAEPGSVMAHTSCATAKGSAGLWGLMVALGLALRRRR